MEVRDDSHVDLRSVGWQRIGQLFYLFPEVKALMQLIDGVGLIVTHV